MYIQNNQSLDYIMTVTNDILQINQHIHVNEEQLRQPSSPQPHCPWHLYTEWQWDDGLMMLHAEKLDISRVDTLWPNNILACQNLLTGHTIEAVGRISIQARYINSIISYPPAGGSVCRWEEMGSLHPIWGEVTQSLHVGYPVTLE